MTENNYDKIKLIILRAALVLVGAGMGFLALWQYFTFYPNVVRHEFQIVISVVSSALIALIFGLSAKAVYRLICSIADATLRLKERVGARGIVAAVLGLVAAGVPVMVFDVIIRRYVDIWAVRLLTDILMYILSAAGCCVGFTKWLNMGGADKAEKAKNADNADGAEKTYRPLPAVGYLLSAECFADERVITAVNTLINVKVCDGAYKALCLYHEGGSDAARLMDALIKSGKLSVIAGKDFDGAEGYELMEKQLANNKRLRLISRSGEMSLSAFTQPTAEMKNALSHANERERVFGFAE
ncbi:MAG: hypothetical protein J1F71_03235 [Clostridiales bacterium]|nr:hypothetical protein [Clostridiales bacterium]